MVNDGIYSAQSPDKKKARQVFDLPRLFVERATRIGLATEAWEAPILPLNYARV